MDALTLAKIVKDREIPRLLSVTRSLVTPLYRASFLASAASSGVLRRLATRPCDLRTLALAVGVDDADRELLRIWLDLGVRLGELDWADDCYRLKSATAKALAAERNDAVAAALEEVVRFHLPVLLDAPDMLREGRRLSLSDQDGELIARSTRVVRPFVEEAINHALDRRSAVRLLEVGCGGGAYVKYAAELNPRLTALAIDLQKDVCTLAAENVAEWGLADRIEVRHADVRDLAVEPQFDLVTMHNNIYYFAEDERTEILARVRSFLAPGGRLLLTTPCRGGSVGLEVLNLWFSYADFGGPLPTAGDLATALRQAGFGDVVVRRLIPGDQFRSFVATNTRATGLER